MSKPNVIPKERLSAYERWEMVNFEAPGRAPATLTTAAQVEQIHRQAREEGRRAGFEEGSKRAAAEAARIGSLAAAFTHETRELDQLLAQQILDLALEAARQMLNCALAVQPELVLHVVREAMRSLPVLGESRQLHLHPDDAQLVRKHLGDTLAAGGWVIADDPAIRRGGCQIIASHGEVDATLETRWRRILAGLGCDGAWIDGGAT